MACHGRGVHAPACVFQNHGNGDLRLVHRRKGDKPSVVAVLHAQRGGVIAFALRDLHHLRRARFAAHGVAQARADFGRRAAVLQHQLHPTFHIIEIALFIRQHALGLGVNHGDLLIFMVQQLFHQMRAVHCAVVCQRGGGVRHLQRRVGVVALPDTHRHHLGGIPTLLLFRAFRPAFCLPSRAGQNAAILARQINARALAKAKRSQIRKGFFYPQFIA